jgi:hypothetical protein
MKAILGRMGKPEQIYCDKGKEFNNVSFMRYLEDEGIKLIMVRRHAPFVERFNKTLKTTLYKVMNDKGFSRWRSYLPDVITNYNNSYHRTIKMTPNEVRRREQEAFENIGLAGSFGKPMADFAEGDTVRLLLKKGDFSRGYKPSFSKRAYRVEEVEGEYVKVDGEWRYKYDVKKFAAEPDDEAEDEGVQVEKDMRQKRILRRVGIDLGNIVEGKRR